MTAANPYKVDFTVPANLADGSYQVWIHNGHGGNYGWSGPIPLTVNDGMQWATGQTFNVKDYGAKGDGVTDDEAAIEAAMDAASNVPWSTVYLPTGTYMVSQGFFPRNQVRWLGDGPKQTSIKCNSNFVNPAAMAAAIVCFSTMGVSDVTFQGLTINPNGNLNRYLTTPIHMRNSDNVRFINVTINAKGYDTADFHASTHLSFRIARSWTAGPASSSARPGKSSSMAAHLWRERRQHDVTWWGGDSMSCTNTTAQDLR